MGRIECSDIAKAFAMAARGMDLHAAWVKCGRPGTWGNIQRRFKAKASAPAEQRACKAFAACRGIDESGAADARGRRRLAADSSQASAQPGAVPSLEVGAHGQLRPAVGHARGLVGPADDAADLAPDRGGHG